MGIFWDNHHAGALKREVPHKSKNHGQVLLVGGGDDSLSRTDPPGCTIAVAPVRAAGSPVRIVLKSKKSTLAIDREDVSFLEADVVDANGTIVPDAHPWISFHVDGPGRLLGGATEIDAISGVSAINVQTSGQPGEVIVTATAEGLEPGSVRIQANKE